MIRRIIQIDEEKCNGCGACAEACHEGAIGMVNGKATLLRDDYCDGLGDSQETTPSARVQTESQLGQWPCQIKLVPTNALYFDGAKLLIAADCSAYAYARMHEDFMRGKITIIGCPKLDSIDYSVTVVRMEVPCCGGLELAAKKALQASGKFIPWQIVTISLDGKILE